VALFPAEDFYHPPEVVIRTEIGREARGHFNLIHHATGFKADIYPIGRDALHRWAMAKRRIVELGSHHISLAPAEYVIIRKLQYYQEGRSVKHLRDIRGILATSGSDIDMTELDARIVQLGLSETWKELSEQP